MKINLDKKFKDLKGTLVEKSNMAEAAANMILELQKGSEIKRYNLATELYQKKTINVDIADYDLLYEAAETCKGFGTITKAQVMLALRKCKEESEKKK